MSNCSPCRTVSFGVIAYNEQNALPDLLEDLLNQTFPKDRIEVILVDGDSSDRTPAIMDRFREKYKDIFREIRVLNNPKRIQPAGWNVVIRHMTSDALLRIDAHARIPADFVESSISCLNTGEYVCGGPRENIIDEDTPWKRLLLTAEQSMFGSGFAGYRQATEEKKYVKSVFHAAYRREVLDAVGPFNEDLIRTEDNEYHYRVRNAGYKICYDPAIHSSYQTRNNLKGMLRQKYQNGFWIGRTLFVCPGCISVFHLVPFAFVTAIGITTVAAICGITWPASALWLAYAAANLGMTVASVLGQRERNSLSIVLPAVFLLLHLSYGAGTAAGICSMIGKKAAAGRKDSQVPN